MEHSLSNPALRRQYDAAGFGGRVGWGSRPALLVIDMAGAWTSPSEQLGSDLSGVMRINPRTAADRPPAEDSNLLHNDGVRITGGSR